MAVRFDLWSTEREQAKITEDGLRVLTKDAPPIAMIWHPKGTKPAAHFRFRTCELRDKYIVEYLATFARNIEDKLARRLNARDRASQLTSTVDVGHIFCYSWGYDQTNVNYYQVTAKHGQNVTVREIAQSVVPGSEGMMSSQREPRIGRFLENKQPFTKRVQFTDDGRAYLSFDFGWCELWRGGAHYESHYH